MKKITYTIAAAFALLASSNALAQQGFGTNRPDKSSAVEIASPNKGLLIPRVALTSATDVTTVNNPANSLLIYNEKEIDNELHAGYYYWSAAESKWISFSTSLHSNNTSVSHGGQNLDVTPSTINNSDGTTTTDYQVKIVPGEEEQFLITKKVNNVLETVWAPYSEIAAGIAADNGLKLVGNTVKMGGDLTEDTKINVNGKKFIILNLPTVTDLTDQMIALNHSTSGEMSLTSATEVVSSGLTHDLTSAANEMTATINGVAKNANIINENKLDIADNTTLLTSEVNGVGASIDMKNAIQLGQVKYEVTAGSGVTIDTSGSTDDLKKFMVNADAGAISLAGDVTGAVSNNKVEKIQNIPVSAAVPTEGQVFKNVSGTWMPAALEPADIENGKKLSSTDLSISIENNAALLQDLTIDIKESAVTGEKLNSNTAGEGLLKNASTHALDVQVKNGIYIDDNFVKLGGELTEKTIITTSTAHPLTLKGLDNTQTVDKVMVVDAEGVLKTTSLQNIKSTNAIETTKVSLDATLANETILVDASTTANVNIVLPKAEANNIGKRFYVKLIATNAANTNTVTISSESTIDGDATPIVSSSPYQAWLLQSDGSAWYVVGY